MPWPAESPTGANQGAVDDETLRQAALLAEYETGRREKTEAGAKAHVAIRIARMLAGTIITLAGLAMMPLPGPGLPVLAVGLAVLARDVAWADRLLTHVTDRIPTNDDGGITRSAWITMALSATAGILGSIWFFTR
jgi:Putative transmembrane protein (PGPGW)